MSKTKHKKCSMPWDNLKTVAVHQIKTNIYIYTNVCIRISKFHVCNYLYRKEHVFKTQQFCTIAQAQHKTLASWSVSLPYSCACSYFYWRFNRLSPMRCKQQKVVEKVGWSRDVAAKVQKYPVKHTKHHNLPQVEYFVQWFSRTVVASANVFYHGFKWLAISRTMEYIITYIIQSGNMLTSSDVLSWSSLFSTAIVGSTSPSYECCWPNKGANSCLRRTVSTKCLVNHAYFNP